MSGMHITDRQSTTHQALEMTELETLLARSERPLLTPDDWFASGSERAMKNLLLEVCVWVRGGREGVGVEEGGLPERARFVELP